MKVVVTGAKGQLGQEVLSQFGVSHTVLGFDSDTMDITDSVSVNAIISTHQPDLVLHCAAWTNVDEAARNPEVAMSVNGQGTRHVAEACAAAKAKLIYISTNEVFAGEPSRKYSESDTPAPINPYGESKLAGEVAVTEVMPELDWVIVRTSWLYGPTSIRNFPNKMIQIADEKGGLKVVDDEISTPTYVPDLVKALLGTADHSLHGIMHLVNEGYCSRYDWAKQVLLATGRQNIPIEAIKLKDFPRPTTVPPHAVLVNSAAKQAGIILPDWQASNDLFCKALTD